MIFQLNLPITFGDIACSKSHLDAVKDRYSEIRISFNKPDIVTQKNNNPEYYKFLDELGNLLFSDFPYVYQPEPTTPMRAQFHILSDNEFKPQIPNQEKYMVSGTPLHIGPYIVLTTKIRYLLRSDFDNIKENLFNKLNELSKKYKIVIIGERLVELQHEYTYQSNEIYGIYDDIKEKLNFENVLDLTIPALGITAPNLKQLQQDCLIMNQAQAVVMLGIGGNFNAAIMSGSRVISFRGDNEPIGNMLYGENFQNDKILVTKDFNKFIQKLDTI